MTEKINAEYVIKIIRSDTEFSVSDYVVPEDAFGKRMIAMMLTRIAEHIDPSLFFKDEDAGSNVGQKEK